MMKKIFTLLITIALSVSLYAFQGPSKLSITSATSDHIRVIVDGNKYPANNNVLTINDLDAGFHTVKIFRVNNYRRTYNDNSFNRFELVYNGRVYLKPQYFVDIVINRFGKAFVDEQLMSPADYPDEADEWDEMGYINSGDNNFPSIGSGMSASSFERFKQSLNNEGFDNTRLSIAKQVISTNYFTSKQAKEIVELFTYESSKVEIAKFTYKYTLDKGSYFLVNDAFTYSSSKQELMEYIQANK